MTKYVGLIIAWIVVAGIVLYIVRHYADLVSGFSVVQQMFDTDGVFEKLFN